jgi:hypothetical protein
MNYSGKFRILLALLFIAFLMILSLLFFPNLLFYFFPHKSGLDGLGFFINIFYIYVPLTLVFLVIITTGLFIWEKFFTKDNPNSPKKTSF